MSSGFSFFSSKGINANEVPPKPPTQTVADYEAPVSVKVATVEEIAFLYPVIASDSSAKLFKSAEAKLVKKKKRAPKVGFGRVDDSLEDDPDCVNGSSVYEASISDSLSLPDCESSHHTADDEAQAPQSLAKFSSLDKSHDSLKEAVPEKSASNSREYSARNDKTESDAIHLSVGSSEPIVASADLSNSIVLGSATEIMRTSTDSTVRRDSNKAAEVAVTATKPVTESEGARKETLPVKSSYTPSAFMFEGMSLVNATQSSNSDTPKGIVNPLTVAESASPSIVEATRVASSDGSGAAQVKIPSTSGTDRIKADTAHGDKVTAANEIKPSRSSSMREVSSTPSLFDGLYEETAAQNLHEEKKNIESAASSDVQNAASGPFIPEQSSKSVESSGGLSETETICSNITSRIILLVQEQTRLSRISSDRRQELHKCKCRIAEITDLCREVELKQASLAAEEKFDEADSLTETLENLQNEIPTQRKKCEELEEQITDMKNSNISPGSESTVQSDIRTDQVDAIRELLSALSSAAREEEHRMTSVKNKKDAQLIADAVRLKGEEDRLRVEEAYTTEEEATLAELSLEMEVAIAAQAGPAVGRRDSLLSQRGVLAREIEELEKLLAAKHAEDNLIVQELDDVHDRINVVRQSFQRQIQRIEDRRTLLADTKTSLTLDLSVLSKSQQEHDQKIEKLKIMKMETTNRCQRILNDVSELSRAISVVYNTHTSQDKDDEKEIEGQLSISRPLSSDRDGHSTAEKNGSGDGRVSEVADENENKGEDEAEKEREKDLYLSAAAHLKAIDQRLCIAMQAQMDVISLGEGLESEAKKVQDLCVILEMDKKAHALARRFKEAALVAKEEKNLQQKREELAASILETAQLRVEKSEEVVQLQRSREAAAAEESRTKFLFDSCTHKSMNRQIRVLRNFKSDLSTLEESNDDCKNGGERNGHNNEVPNGSNREENGSEFGNLSAFLIASKVEELSIEMRYLETLHPSLIFFEEAPLEVPAATEIETIEGTRNGVDPTVDSTSSIITDANTASRNGNEKGDENKNENSSGIKESPESKILTEDGCKDGNNEGGNSENTENCGLSDDDADVDANVDAGAVESGEEERVVSERAARITIAKELISNLINLERELTEASEAEDYEKADEVDAIITAAKKDLLAALLTLNMTEEQVKDS